MREWLEAAAGMLILGALFAAVYLGAYLAGPDALGAIAGILR